MNQKQYEKSQIKRQIKDLKEQAKWCWNYGYECEETRPNKALMLYEEARICQVKVMELEKKLASL